MARSKNGADKSALMSRTVTITGDHYDAGDMNRW